MSRGMSLSCYILFSCEIEERGVNSVIYEMRGGNNFRKKYLRGALKALRGCEEEGLIF